MLPGQSRRNASLARPDLPMKLISPVIQREVNHPPSPVVFTQKITQRSLVEIPGTQKALEHGALTSGKRLFEWVLSADW